MLGVGLGSLFSGMNCLLWSDHGEEPQECRGSERLSRGEEETGGCTFGQGSWPWGRVTGLLNPKPYRVGSAILPIILEDAEAYGAGAGH